jgi:hypothetical protein
VIGKMTSLLLSLALFSSCAFPDDEEIGEEDLEVTVTCGGVTYTRPTFLTPPGDGQNYVSAPNICGSNGIKPCAFYTGQCVAGSFEERAPSTFDSYDPATRQWRLWAGTTSVPVYTYYRETNIETASGGPSPAPFMGGQYEICPSGTDATPGLVYEYVNRTCAPGKANCYVLVPAHCTRTDVSCQFFLGSCTRGRKPNFRPFMDTDSFWPRASGGPVWLLWAGSASSTPFRIYWRDKPPVTGEL